MKKLILLSAIAVLTLTQITAQESTFNKGDKVVNLGVGIGTTHAIPFGAIFSASFDAGIVDKIAKKGSIGVGGYIGFTSGNYSEFYRASELIIAGRGTFHYPLVKKLDTYAGLSLGYGIGTLHSRVAGDHYEPTAGGAVSSLFGGARYFFSENFAGFSEVTLGYGPTNINVGVSFKF